MEKTDLTPIIAIFNDFFTSVYKAEIDRLLIVYPNKKSLFVDYQALEKFDPEIADKLQHEPDIVIDAAEKAIEEMNLPLPSGENKFAPHIRFFNVPSSDLLIEQLNSKNINELVAFKAVVTKRAEVMNRVKIAVFRCQICDSMLRVPVIKNFSPPKRCDSCKKLALKQMDEDSDFVDIQRAEVQELLERVTGGAPSARIELLFEDDLVNTANPGENIELVGMLRLRPPIKTRQKQEFVYTRYLEVNNIINLKKDFEQLEITKEEVQKIQEYSKDPNIEKLIIDSVAPGIYGHEEVKWAIALQLFGGTKGKTMKGGAKMRDDIHLLLIGDPGLAKSRFLQQTATIAPKAIFVSGKTVSGVGLCVAGDSLITLNDAGLQKIGDFVEKNFSDANEEIKDAFSSRFDSKVLSLDNDLKINYQNSPKIWKIKPPKKMIHLVTQQGKEIKITPNTQLIRIENEKPTWIKSSNVKEGDLIATAKSNINPLDSDIYWDKVVEKKEYSPNDKWVYDLTVKDNHNFIANGIIVHNTVSAEKDELGDGGWTLKAGALVLASGGMAMLDEFDKIDEEDRAALHEAMESAQISIAKAGMVAKFRTKTAILAAANPKLGRFDQNKNLAEQFNITPTLLSRFDLIFPIVDVLDDEKDSRLASHILKSHMGQETDELSKRAIDHDILRKYISYARREIRPLLTEAASERIKEFYVDLRRKGKDTGSVPITPRYLEGLVRLAEANAKMRLSETVDDKDAETAIKLLDFVMRQVMTDKETGTLDIDTITTGKPKSERDKLQRVDTILEIIREMLKSNDSADTEEIVDAASSYDIDAKTAKRIISELLRKGDIYEKEHGQVKIVGG